MDIFSLVGKLKLDGADSVHQELDKVKDGTEQVQKSMKIMGAAFTAVGAMGLKFVDSAREINAQLGSTGITLGKTTAEMRDLTLATTNVTFPIKSVVATFDLLARAGERNTEAMKAVANTFDALADATNSSADIVADMLIPVFRAFNMELPKTTEEMDKFTWLTKNTTINLSEFADVVRRLSPEMRAANISFDDTIIALAGLEARGITGRKATAELGQAITRAASNGTTLATELGLTTDEVAKYKDELDKASGLTKKHADAMNEQYGIMDKLKQKWSELTLGAGSFLTPLEPILAGMTALGPIMIGMSMLKLPMLAGAFSALLGPIGLIIIAIAALIAIGVLVWKNWDAIKAMGISIWESITNIFTSAAIQITTIWNNVVAFFYQIPAAIQTAFTWLAEILIAPFRAAIQWVYDAWANLTRWVSQSWSSFTGIFGGIGLPSYEYGGIVPGPIGEPRLVMAHGGERFLGTGATNVGGDTIIVNIGGSVISERQLVAVIREQFLTIKRQNVTMGI